MTVDSFFGPRAQRLLMSKKAQPLIELRGRGLLRSARASAEMTHYGRHQATRGPRRRRTLPPLLPLLIAQVERYGAEIRRDPTCR
jgi:hypothetical protein